MFGSSQDRARQLAARTRREKTSPRSVSSSKQALQQSPTSATLEDHIQQPPVIPEHPSDLAPNGRHTSKGSYAARPLTNDQVASDTIHHVSQPLSAGLHSQIEQHRLQAEYLSQVLYDSLTLPVLGRPPQSHFKRSTHHSRYGSLATQSTTSQYPRSITAPIPPVQSSTKPLSTLPTQPGFPMLPPLQKSAFGNHLQTPTAVSLRGGAGAGARDGNPNHVERAKNTQRVLHADYRPAGSSNLSRGLPSDSLMPDPSIDQRAFAREFRWVSRVFQLPEWEFPIASGVSYDAFLESLSKQESVCFRFLFDLHTPPIDLDCETRARRWFYIDLSPEKKRVFKNIIEARGLGLLDMMRNDSTGKREALFKASDDKSKPFVKLYHLLEATESHPGPYQPSTAARASSAPNMGEVALPTSGL